jgi:SAM-dependent methyltransferase
MAIELRCPRCGSDVEGHRCTSCSFDMTPQEGIVRALPPERAEKYARFVQDYAHIRAAEGRGSQSSDFYLSLPYRDTTGKHSDQWRIRAKSFDYLARRVLKPLQNQGRVLDLGSGNCWMSYRLGLLGMDTVAVDLLVNEEDGLGAACHFEQALGRGMERFQAEVTHLPFRNGQFDAIIFNASFHYAESYEAALGESLRCLKPGGVVVVSDTPWYSQAESGEQMIQERVALFQKRFGTASNSIQSMEYLTDERLSKLEDAFSIRWIKHSPWHGLRRALRPLVARLFHRREPSKFYIYVARKHV